MKETRNSINYTLEKIQEVVDLLYQERKKEAYQKLDTVLASIGETVEKIFIYKEKNSEFNIDDTKLNKALQEALNAMEQEDIVLLADILQFDIMEQFNEIKVNLK